MRGPSRLPNSACSRSMRMPLTVARVARCFMPTANPSCGLRTANQPLHREEESECWVLDRTDVHGEFNLRGRTQLHRGDAARTAILGRLLEAQTSLQRGHSRHYLVVYSLATSDEVWHVELPIHSSYQGMSPIVVASPNADRLIVVAGTGLAHYRVSHRNDKGDPTAYFLAWRGGSAPVPRRCSCA